MFKGHEHLEIHRSAVPRDIIFENENPPKEPYWFEYKKQDN